MRADGLVALAAADAGVNGIVGTPSTRPDKTNGIFPSFMPEGRLCRQSSTRTFTLKTK